MYILHIFVLAMLPWQHLRHVTGHVLTQTQTRLRQTHASNHTVPGPHTAVTGPERSMTSLMCARGKVRGPQGQFSLFTVESLRKSDFLDGS